MGLKDLFDAIFMITDSAYLSYKRGVFGGIVVVFITVGTMVIMLIYIISTGTSDVEVIKTAASLLFLTNLDDKLLQGIRCLFPKWTDERVKDISRTIEGKLARATSLAQEDGQEESREFEDGIQTVQIDENSKSTVNYLKENKKLEKKIKKIENENDGLKKDMKEVKEEMKDAKEEM